MENNNRVGILRILPLAAGAAVFATVCDSVHVLTGTLSYSDPLVFGKPWTVLPGFTVVFLVMMILYDRFFSRLQFLAPVKKSISNGSVQDCIESFLFFVLVYLSSGFGSGYPVALNIIFYGFFLMRWLFTYERKFILVFAIVLGIGGMTGEGLLAEAGLVAYSRPEIFHVPWWLGGVYLHGAMALREVMRAFAYRPI